MISQPWQNAYGPNIPLEIDLPADATLQGLLCDAFARHADLVAITCLSETYSFAKFDELSGALASFFQESGLSQGERVAIITPNCPAFIVTAAAALRSGLVVVPVTHASRISSSACGRACWHPRAHPMPWVHAWEAPSPSGSKARSTLHS